MQNMKSYWMEYSNILQKKLSMKEKQIIFSIHYQFLLNQNILDYTYQQSHQLNNSIQTVFDFEARVIRAFEKLDYAIRIKVNLLSLMKQKLIKAKDLAKNLSCLRTEQNFLCNQLNSLQKINSYNYDLITIQVCYIDNLAFDSNEIVVNFNSFTRDHQFSSKRKQSKNIFPSNNQNPKILKQKLNENDKKQAMDEIELSSQNIFDENTFCLFATIDENYRLVIQNASKNFYEILQTSQKEIYGKNVEQFMPQNTLLPQNHKYYIFNYFQDNNLLNNNLMNKIIFVQTSNGFIIPTQLTLRLNYSFEIQKIGFSSLFKILKNKSEYIMYNTTDNHFIGITQDLQQSIFQNIKLDKNYNLTNIFPFLEYIKRQKENNNFQNKFDHAKNKTIENYQANDIQQDQDNKKEGIEDQYEFEFEFMMMLESRKADSISLSSTMAKNIQKYIGERQYIYYLMDIKIQSTQYKYFPNINYLQITNIRSLNQYQNGFQILQHLKENHEIYQLAYSNQYFDQIISQFQSKYLKYLHNSGPQYASSITGEQQVVKNKSNTFFQQFKQRSNLTEKISNSNQTFMLNSQKKLEQIEEENITYKKTLKQNQFSHNKIENNNNYQDFIQSKISLNELSQNQINNLNQNEEISHDIIQNQEIFYEKQEIIQALTSNVEQMQNLEQHKETNLESIRFKKQAVDLLLSPSVQTGVGLLSDNYRHKEFEFVFSEEENKNHQEFKQVEKQFDKKQSKNTFTELIPQNEVNNSYSQKSFVNLKNFSSNLRKQSQNFDQTTSITSLPLQQKFYQDKSTTDQNIMNDFQKTQESQEKFFQSQKMVKTKKQLKKQLLMKESIENASTKSRESSTSTKRMIIHMIKTKQTILGMQIINLIGFLTFAVLVSVTVQQYVTIINAFNITQDNIQQADWPYNVLNTISQLQINSNTNSLVAQNQFQFDSPQKQSTFSSLIINRLFNIKDSFLQILLQMESSNTGSSLFEIMSNQPITFQNPLYYNQTNKVGQSSTRQGYFTESINVSLLYSSIIFNQFIYRQAISPGAKFNEYMTIINLPNFVDGIQKLENQFNQIQENLNTSVEDKLYNLLIIILVVSASCLVIIIPVYAFIQSKKDIILNLFCTFPASQIKNMLFNIKQTYYSNKITQNFIKIVPVEIQNFNVLNNYDQSQVKKQSMSQLAKSQRFNLCLLFGLFITYLIISLYPIANTIISQQYVNQQRNDLYLFTSIGQLRDFVYNSAGMTAFTLVMRLYPSLKAIKVQDYLYTIDNVKQKEPSIGELMQNITNQQGLIKRYNGEDYDNYFFQIFQSDVCSIILNYQEYILNATSFDLTTCNQIQNGFLKQGLKLSIQKYLSYIDDLTEIIYTNDTNLLQSMQNNLFNTFNITDYTYFVDYIGQTLTMQQQFIQINSNYYYTYIIQVQLALLIFQVVLMVIIFGLGWNCLIGILNEEINTTRQYIQVININDLVDNNYILNFIKNNKKI
ncbi:transmembrane protein, putative (macronuclear) [Tetrahymena thermophila SB210]|uniref:Transmembrane protein, putative n=1 Tax=Tetrahymena thermophila (strain SB210) TaxID=312017 RepID=I7M1M5_TETTS|nr:transmembrane protein, putative [Tetrahymena thermophila SB210]EAR97185.2 transmembrane protein, putative [Tetrahymena thermophila SB210]|eukprot:XP_001017430.2 transmembrane protein, putative [Tetrahymena thermophila SB210]